MPKLTFCIMDLSTSMIKLIQELSLSKNILRIQFLVPFFVFCLVLLCSIFNWSWLLQKRRNLLLLYVRDRLVHGICMWCCWISDILCAPAKKFPSSCGEGDWNGFKLVVGVLLDVRFWYRKWVQTCNHLQILSVKEWLKIRNKKTSGEKIFRFIISIF